MVRIGIDVGGTFTDAVVIENGKVLASAKRRTTHKALLEGILASLDEVLTFFNISEIEYIALSTTVITNQVVANQLDKTDLYIVPGPGSNVESSFPVAPIVLTGAVDHQGRLREEILLSTSSAERASVAAVSVKFGNRNPLVEVTLQNKVQALGYKRVSSGISFGGSLNFSRRTVSAYYNSAVQQGFMTVAEQIERAFMERGISCPLYMLKADGGTLPLEVMKRKPVEAIFTGPAASVRGMERLVAMPEADTVALDIGGTTSDISLWRKGVPCMARGGVSIQGYPSSIRSFQVTSVGIGGDSWVRCDEDGFLKVGPERKGAAMALGGSMPTLGDALIVLDLAQYGDKEASKRGLKKLCNKRYQTVEEVASACLEKAMMDIQKGVIQAIDAENRLPIYKVEDLRHPNPFTIEACVLVGGTARALKQAVEDTFLVPTYVPENAEVANAVGAAAAPRSISLSCHLDTRKRRLVIPELGYEEQTLIHSLEELVTRGKELLISRYHSPLMIQEDDIIVVSQSSFPVLEGWGQVEYMMDIVLEWQGGGIHYVQG